MIHSAKYTSICTIRVLGYNLDGVKMYSNTKVIFEKNKQDATDWLMYTIALSQVVDIDDRHR